LEHSFRTTDISLSLPRFKVTAPSAPLKEMLVAMGLGPAFDASEGAFEPMGSRELHLSEVYHAGVLEVNEAGTEAAAATAAVMMTRGFAAPPLELRFDHPFIFVVEDTRAEGGAEGGGGPIFMARVTRPELTGVAAAEAAAVASPQAGGGTPPPPPWAVAAAAAATVPAAHAPPSPVPFGAAPSVSAWLPAAPAPPPPPAAAALHAADMLAPLRGAISALRRADAHMNACAALACRLARKQAVVADWAAADAASPGAGAAHDATRAPRLALLTETLRDARRIASLCAAARADGRCRAAAEAARAEEVASLLSGCHERLSRHPPVRPRHPHPEQDRLLKRLAAAAAGSDAAGLAAAAHDDALALLASLRGDAAAATRALLAAAPSGPFVSRLSDANSREASALAALAAATGAHATQARSLAEGGATHAAALVARLAAIASATSPFAPRRARALTAAEADADADASTRIEDVLLLHAAAVAHAEALSNSEAVIPLRASMASAHAALEAALAQTDAELRAALEVTARDGGAAAAPAAALLSASPHVAALRGRCAAAARGVTRDALALRADVRRLGGKLSAPLARMASGSGDAHEDVAQALSLLTATLAPPRGSSAGGPSRSASTASALDRTASGEADGEGSESESASAAPLTPLSSPTRGASAASADADAAGAAAKLRRCADALSEAFSAEGAAPELQAALKPVQRQVELAASAAAALASLLSDAATAPAALRLAPRAARLAARVGALCAGVDAHAHARRLHSLARSLRVVLSSLSDALSEVEAAAAAAAPPRAAAARFAASGVSYDASWAGGLWRRAFGDRAVRGALSTLLAASPPEADARFAAFIGLKREALALGGGDRVSAEELASVCAAGSRGARLLALGGMAVSNAVHAPPPLAPIAAQCALDRVLAYIDEAAAKASERQASASCAAPPPLRVRVRHVPRHEAMRLRARPGAEVPPGFDAADDAAADVADVDASSVAFLGDDVCLDVIASHDCVFFLGEQDATGAVCPLLPNAITGAGANNALAARAHRIVPDRADGDEFDIAFAPPLGLERVFVVASRDGAWRGWADACEGEGEAQSGALLEALMEHAVAARAAARPLAAAVHTFELRERRA
jgi:hypothetical protein